MLSTATRLRLQEILLRIANQREVSLNERVYLHKFADRDQTVARWLHRARKMQLKNGSTEGVDKLLEDLSLGSTDPQENFNPENDDLGDWFSGAPSWLGRS